MGWFGIGGGGGKDPNNPLSDIEVPKDQQPAEVEKPASAKDWVFFWSFLSTSRFVNRFE